MRQRIDYFDQMKGVAILLVVIGHVMQFSFGIPKSNVVDMLGIFHMPIFFFVSGYFTYKERVFHFKLSFDKFFESSLDNDYYFYNYTKD